MRFLISVLSLILLSVTSSAVAQQSGNQWALAFNGTPFAQVGDADGACKALLDGDLVREECPDGSIRVTFASVVFLGGSVHQCTFVPAQDRCPSEISPISGSIVDIRRSTPGECQRPSEYQEKLTLGTAPPQECELPCDTSSGRCQKDRDGSDCQECGPNPINFNTGQKFRSEVDYVGNGAFPLRIERFYNSLGNKIRTGEGLESDPEFPVQEIPPAATTIILAPTTRDSFRELEAEIFTDPQDKLVNYNGNLANKWRHYYDRFLLASFEESGIDPSETPEVINVYRFDGKQEVYGWNGTIYEPENSYKSTVTRLDISHPLAPGWQLVTETNEIEYYDLAGRLLQMSSPSGLSHHLTYDAVNTAQLTTVTDDFGHTLQFFYEDISDPTLLTRIVDPDGNEYRYTYTARGMIASAIYPDLTPADPNDNPDRIYLYDDPRYPDGMTGIIDENGDVMVSYTYDEFGRAISTELGGGVSHFDITYDVAGSTRTEVNDLGLETLYTFNAEGLIASETRQASPGGFFPAATQTTTYDALGFRSSTSDWNGNVINFTHDSRGLETSRTEAFGTPDERTITTTWHPTLRLPTQIIEPGRTTDFTYDASGNVLTRTETDTTTQSIPYSTAGRTRTTTFTYHPEGVNGQFMVATQDGPRTDVSDVTTFTYTAEGFIDTVTNPLNQTTQVTSYNSRGQPLSMTDSNGVVTNMTYHPRGWLLTSTVVDPSASGNDAVTTNDYDDVGQLTRVTLPNGAFLNYEYDAAHRLTAISNNLGERQEFTLDDAGNVTAEITRAAAGSITRTQNRVYDELSRIYQVVGGANQLSQMEYDGNGNETSVALDPSGINQSTLQAFDALNRLATVTDALNNNSNFTYDARDNLITVTDQRGLVTTFTYDGLNNLIQQDSPDTGITIFTYDDAGNQISKTDSRSVVTNNSFDALNRLTAVSYPASPVENITYSYDQPGGGFGVGRLTQIADQTGTTSMVYDYRGNQISSAVTIQGNNYTTAYAYDLADNLIQTTYPSGRIVDHQLDVLGRTQGVSSAAQAGGSAQTLANNIAYLPFGPMNGLDYGNGLDLVISNDLDYRVTGITVQDGGGQNPDVLGLTYTQNAVDNITAIADSVDTNESQTFIYDLLNRLEDATGDYGNQAFTYDGVGNRLSLTRLVDGNTSTEVYTYDTNSNRLLSVDKDGVVRTLQYDAAGNVVSDDRGADQGFTLEYNDQNRLLNATPTGGQ